MQIVHNKFLGEFYLYDGNRKRTIICDRGVWSCSCYQPDCQHIQEIQAWIKQGGDK